MQIDMQGIQLKNGKPQIVYRNFKSAKTLTEAHARIPKKPIFSTMFSTLSLALSKELSSSGFFFFSSKNSLSSSSLSSSSSSGSCPERRCALVKTKVGSLTHSSNIIHTASDRFSRHGYSGKDGFSGTKTP